MFDVNQYVKKITESRPAGGGNPIRDGDYLQAIKSLQIKPTDKGGSEVWFIMELRVLSAKPVDILPDSIGPESEKKLPVHPPNAVGSDCTMLTDLNSQMGGANVKEVIAADLGVKHDQITAEHVSAWLNANVDVPGQPSKGQPKAGRVLACKTTRSKTKGGKNPGSWGVRLHWDHVPQTPEELTGIRATLIQTAAPNAAAPSL